MLYLQHLRISMTALAPEHFIQKLTLAGDLNGDGFVGLDDLDLILNNWNQTVTPSAAADPTGDGYVGLDDLDIVLNNWNAGTLPVDSANIPEPVSAVLLAAGGLGLVSRRGELL